MFGVGRTGGAQQSRSAGRNLSVFTIFLGGLGLCGGAGAAELKIVDVKAYVFLEHGGRLSDDIIGSEPLINAPKGGAPGGDTATALILDLTFAGEKNVSPKYATATVDLTQTNSTGQKVVTHKAFTNFIFDANGAEHKVVLLEGATCAPLAIEIHAGKTSKTARLDFQCDTVRAAN
jgi:hypothetical protein